MKPIPRMKQRGLLGVEIEECDPPEEHLREQAALRAMWKRQAEERRRRRWGAFVAWFRWQEYAALVLFCVALYIGNWAAAIGMVVGYFFGWLDSR